MEGNDTTYTIIYAIQSLEYSKTDFKDMNKTQARFVKAGSSVVKYCRSPSLMNAIYLTNLETYIAFVCVTKCYLINQEQGTLILFLYNMIQKH